MNDSQGAEELEEDRREMGKVVERKKEKNVVLMWGYLPGVSPERSPLLHPVPVRRPESAAGDAWRDVSGGGCGFAMAISGELWNPPVFLNFDTLWIPFLVLPHGVSNGLFPSGLYLCTYCGCLKILADLNL